MEQLTFDKAIELLEITDISKITLDDIPTLEKKAKKRWHPDKVEHLKNSQINAEYTTNFQQVEAACQMVSAYLEGTYHPGQAFIFSEEKQSEYKEPEEIIRENAEEIQADLKDIRDYVKEKKYKNSEQEVILSDGFRLKDLLEEDFKEDIAMLSVVSFFYGLLLFGILVAIASAISPVLGSIVGIVWALQAISCVLGFAPLSRIWLNEQISETMLGFINFGLRIYYWAAEQGENSNNNWVLLFVHLPALFAKIIKYIVLFPLYEIAKLVVADKVVGVVKQTVNYYADVAEWYIDELLNKDPYTMTSEELFHLSYMNTELSNVKSEI